MRGAKGGRKPLNIVCQAFKLWCANIIHLLLLYPRKLYHPNNAQLGMALMRAGVTHWHAGLIEAGHGMICKAFAILLVTHGPSHPITKDLEVGDCCGMVKL